jgi:Tfp pilus assembly protein PilZ
MLRIMIVSDTEKTSSEIRFAIERNMSHQVVQVYNRGDMKKNLETTVFNLVIIDSVLVDERVHEKINWFRSVGCVFPILVVAENMTPRYAQKLAVIEDVHALMRPYYEKNIVGLVRKLLVARRLPKQIYRRFNTNQMGHIEGLVSGDSLLISMYNLSQGGAYIEFDCAKPLSVGDLYKLSVQIENSKNQYSFNAKVVWTTPEGRFSGRFGCGLRFVTAKETHHTLLMKT